MNWRRKSRLRKSHITSRILIGIFVALNILTSVILIHFLEATTSFDKFEVVLPVFGVYFAIFTIPTITTFRKKKIIVLGYSDSYFWRNVKEGLKEKIKEFNGDVSKKFLGNTFLYKGERLKLEHIPAPVDRSESRLEFIKEELENLKRKKDFHALVIRFEQEDDEISKLLADLTAKGIFIVVVSVKVPNRFFYMRDLQPPKFVSTDFHEGGKLVSEALIELDNQINLSGVILISGPVGAYPNHLRTLTATYYTILNKQPHLQVHIHIMKPTFGKDHFEQEKDLDKPIQELDSKMEANASGKIAIYSGNDNIGEEICKLISKAQRSDGTNTPNSLYERKFYVIGFDKSSNDSGVICNQYEDFIATINTKPNEKGQKAAQFLIDEFEGTLLKEGRTLNAANWKKNDTTDPEPYLSGEGKALLAKLLEGKSDK